MSATSIIGHELAHGLSAMLSGGCDETFVVANLGDHLCCTFRASFVQPEALLAGICGGPFFDYNLKAGRAIGDQGTQLQNLRDALNAYENAPVDKDSDIHKIIDLLSGKQASLGQIETTYAFTKAIKGAAIAYKLYRQQHAWMEAIAAQLDKLDFEQGVIVNGLDLLRLYNNPAHIFHLPVVHDLSGFELTGRVPA